MHRKALSVILSACLTVSAWPVVGGHADASPSANRAAEVGAAEGLGGFTDMAGHWASKAVERLSGLGIVQGDPDGRYRPDEPVSRSEFVAILNRSFRYVQESAQGFKDVKATAWYAQDLSKALAAGIVSGYEDGSFRPQETIKRQDAALLMGKAFKLNAQEEGVLPFKDAGAVAGYARGAVQAAIKTGYLNGDGQGEFRPAKPLTRAEAASMLSRAFGWIGSAPGSYELSEIQGFAIINQPGVTLNNTIVHGNLYITEGVGEGDVVLDGVTVEGDTYIEGGGANSVHFNRSHAATVTLSKKGNPVRIVFGSGSSATKVIANEQSLLELSADSQVKELLIEEGAQGTSIDNKGTIGQLNVKADGVKLNGETAAKGIRNSLSGAKPVQPGGVTPPGNTPSPETKTDDWTLVWSDEFNGSAIDATKWNVQDTGVVYNNELEYYHPDNAAIVQDGTNRVLRLSAKKQDYAGRSYTSGKLTSKSKGDWTYGKFVVRAKLPVQQGMWPAIWMMPTDEQEQYGPWPGSGEMDIMELTGPKAGDPASADENPRKVQGTIHYDASHGSQANHYYLPQGQTFADDYHDFSMEWLPGLIRMYVDGHLYFETRDWGTKGANEADYYSYPAPFDRPFYMILNLAVGGDMPGDPKADFAIDHMDIDYVRVYEYNKLGSWPDVTGIRPDGNAGATAKRQPLEDGNQIYNGTFAAGTTSSGVPTDWEFLLNEGGAGSVSVVEDSVKGKAAKVEVQAAGNQKYSIQLTQMPLFLEKGKTYKVTFDAKADASRTIMSKATQFGGGWTAYSQERSFTLSDQWQSYEYIFQMKASTDNNARFEFNLGQSAVAAYFANVRLTETDPLPPEPRAALPGGNLVFNGSFDQGVDRMGYWQVQQTNALANTAVTNDLVFPMMQRMFKANIRTDGSPEDVKLIQPELPVGEGVYTLTFDARADSARNIRVALNAGEDAHASYAGGADIELSTELRTYTKAITLESDQALSEASLEFLLGGSPGAVYIDNVKLVKRNFPTRLSDYSNYAASAFWIAEGVELASNSEGGQSLIGFETGDYALFKVNADGGDYVPMVRVSAAAGSRLTLKVLDEQKNLLKTVEADIPNEGTSGAYETIWLPKLQLAGEYFMQIEGSGFNLAWLEFSRELAANGGFDEGDIGWTLFKDAADPVKDSVISAVYGSLDVHLTGTGNEDWHVQVKQAGKSLKQGKVYRLHFDASSSRARDIYALVQRDGSIDNNWTSYLNKTVSLKADTTAFDYVFVMPANDNAATLQFSMGKIGDASGEYDIKLDNISLMQVNPILAGLSTDGSLLPNGKFDTGIEGWSSYSPDAGELAIGHGDEGTLRINVGTTGTNPWDRQVYYEGIPYDNGNRYTLTFKAKATSARKMNISVGWLDAKYQWHAYGSQIVDLGTDDYQYFTYTFDVQPDSTPLGRISFELGKIDERGADTTVEIDEIRLIKVGPTP